MPDTHFAGPLHSYQIHPGFQSGVWYPPPCTNLGGGAMPNNTLRLVPFPVGRQQAFDAIGIYQTALGTDAGATSRLGVYASDVNGYPAGLLVDAGSFNSGSGGATGAHQILLPQPILLPAGLYWLGFVNQNAPGTAPAVSLIFVMDAIQLPVPTPQQSYALGGDLTGVTGALPSVTGITAFTAQTAPRVMLRAV